MRASTSPGGSREQHSACERAIAEAAPPTPSATLKATAADGVVEQRRQTTTFELALDRSQLAGALAVAGHRWISQTAEPQEHNCPSRVGICPPAREQELYVITGVASRLCKRSDNVISVPLCGRRVCSVVLGD
jgi:hypothetical protein